MKRATIMILDSLGTGSSASADAVDFGDVGANTFSNFSKSFAIAGNAAEEAFFITKNYRSSAIMTGLI